MKEYATESTLTNMINSSPVGKELCVMFEGIPKIIDGVVVESAEWALDVSDLIAAHQQALQSAVTGWNKRAN